ncbi:MAG: hypothetical protein ACLTGT_03170 [Oscillospiraceae bacterium]
MLRQRWRYGRRLLCRRTAGAAFGGLVPGLVVYLLPAGVLLCFVQGSAIGRRAKTITAGALVLVLLIGLLPEGLSGGASPRRWGGGSAGPAPWHYEDAADPLPEETSRRGLFPGQEPALADHGTLDALYLRGYVAGVHRHRLAAAGGPPLTEEAPMLYSLQAAISSRPSSWRRPTVRPRARTM